MKNFNPRMERLEKRLKRRGKRGDWFKKQVLRENFALGRMRHEGTPGFAR